MRLRVMNPGICVVFALLVLASCPAQVDEPAADAIAQPVVQSVTPAPQHASAPVADPKWVGDAMDFSFTTFDGETIMASSYAGKPLVLNFWASW